MKDNKPELKVGIKISGNYEDVISYVSVLRPKKAESLVTITIRAKSLESSWHVPYDLPVINGPNTLVAHKNLEGLYRQARITKEQYEEAKQAIDRLSRIAHEEEKYNQRYGHGSMNN